MSAPEEPGLIQTGRLVEANKSGFTLKAASVSSGGVYSTPTGGVSTNVSFFTDETPTGRVRKQYLRASYPANSCAPGDKYKGDTGSTAALAGQDRPFGGVNQFIGDPLGRRFKKARLKYSFRFKSGFDFRLGGKLPGLSTLDVNASGGHAENGGITSFTARLMWKGQEGAVPPRVHPYFYMADNEVRWGSIYGVDPDQSTKFYVSTSGWNTVEQTVWVNDVISEGNHDSAVVDRNGGYKLSVNGVESGRSDLVWRLNNNLLIDGFYFSTFFGGNTFTNGDNTYETLVDTHLDFSDLIFEGME